MTAHERAVYRLHCVYGVSYRVDYQGNEGLKRIAGDLYGLLHLSEGYHNYMLCLGFDKLYTHSHTEVTPTPQYM